MQDVVALADLVCHQTKLGRKADRAENGHGGAQRRKPVFQQNGAPGSAKINIQTELRDRDDEGDDRVRHDANARDAKQIILNGGRDGRGEAAQRDDAPALLIHRLQDRLQTRPPRAAAAHKIEAEVPRQNKSDDTARGRARQHDRDRMKTEYPAGRQEQECARDRNQPGDDEYRGKRGHIHGIKIAGGFEPIQNGRSHLKRRFAGATSLRGRFGVVPPSEGV